MHRFIKWLILYGTPLYIATIVFVFVFQSYWLWDNFEERKNRILHDVEFIIERKLVSTILDKLSATTNLLEATANEEDVSLKDMDSMLNKRQVTDKKLDILEKYGSSAAGIKDPFFYITGTFFNDAAYDSLLYNDLKDKFSFLSENSGLVIYHIKPQQITSYPRGLKIKETDSKTTKAMASILNKGSYFRAYIGNLDWIVLCSMAIPFTLSFLFIALLLITAITLRRAATMNKHLLESKRIFTQNMTHELKMPISTLFVAVEALDTYDAISDAREAKKYLGAIKRGLGNLSSIVDTILKNASIDREHTSLNLQAIDINNLLEDVKESMQFQLSKADGSINITYHSNHAVIPADYELIKHALLNIFDNAIKYTNSTPLIEVSVQANNSYLRMLITDNGRGIPKQYFDEIFQPYFRVSDPDLHNVKGFGLGLSFVRQIIDLHKGTIRIIKSDDSGTTIELKLPGNG